MIREVRQTISVLIGNTSCQEVELLICIFITTHLIKSSFKKMLTDWWEPIFVPVIKSGVGGTQQPKPKQQRVTNQPCGPPWTCPEIICPTCSNLASIVCLGQHDVSKLCSHSRSMVNVTGSLTIQMYQYFSL